MVRYVIATVVFALAATALGSETADVAAAPMAPCRTVPFAVNLVPGYDGVQIPTVIRCTLAVGPGRPRYTITFTQVSQERGAAMSRRRYRVAVEGADGEAQALADAVFPGIGGCGMEVGDFNFDGFTDLALPESFLSSGMEPKECHRAYLLYDPATNRLTRREALSALVDPWFEGWSKDVRTYCGFRPIVITQIGPS